MRRYINDQRADERLCIAAASVSAAVAYDGFCGDDFRPQHWRSAWISESAFANFVAREIAPRFPDGLTVINGDGQWRDGARNVDVRERAKVVLITFADDARKRADLGAIAESYKLQFGQQSVLTKVGNVCVSF